MAPFLTPNAVVNGFKEKIDSLTVHGDRLYVGTSTGNLHIYGLEESEDDGGDTAHLVETKKAFSRRAIEHLGFLKDINSLAVLSDAQVTLYPLPALSPATPLPKSKGALSFAIHSSVQYLLPDGNVEQRADGDFTGSTSKGIPAVVTQLVIGCRRKVVIYSWKDGEPQDVKEAPLLHSPRAIAFHNADTVALAYPPPDYDVFSIRSLTATEVVSPPPKNAAVASTSMAGMGAFTGLTGYMTLGLGAKPKSDVVAIGGDEILIVKDNEGVVIGVDGKSSRTDTVVWPAPPEDIAFIKPYILSVLPPGSVTSAQKPSSTAPHSSVIQIHSSLSLLPTQLTTVPPLSDDAPSTTTQYTARLLTALSSTKAPLFLVTTPTDRTAANAEGSTVWQIRMRPWSEQIDELVQQGAYGDALALLDTVDQTVLPDKEQRRTRIRALHAVSLFSSGKFDDAINTFIELDLNPAKVVALYPETVSGRLSVPREAWIPLYGGPVPVPVPGTDKSTPSNSSSGDVSTERKEEDSTTELPDESQGHAGRSRFKTGLGALLGSPRDDSVSSTKRPRRPEADEFHRSVETLLRYLTDRRPKLAGALAAVHITPSQSHSIAFLSETSTEDLFALPNAPLSSLTPEQLLRFAQVVDTALFKVYLQTRPGLLGVLCRAANWCEVSEVEEELRAHEKFAELIYLYNGKKMHAKALDLLRQLSEKETTTRDKLMPSITYLQKLGPEHLQQIFESSRWLFDEDKEMAFEIFTSEEVELPRASVADFLEDIDPYVCARYLEYIIAERREESAEFHERLAELYLSLTLDAKRRGDEKSRKAAYSNLLQFIDTTHHYRPDRLYGLVSSHDLFEARAILLGRLGRHDQALEMYAYRLKDFLKAEEYCKRVYQPGTPTSGIFLTLLRIYLRSTPDNSDYLTPALDLISRHSRRLDAIEALHLLPPLVTAEDVRTFLIEALRAPIFDAQVIREISKARNEQLARKLMSIETKRVKITDSRICPQCHKRLGNSVIAVHAPRGEVTHYQCREAFSRKLNETRR
ncbi:hypothetical protein PLICRDRAFT_108036 [Plicaturopsis crispa FD-325 SS-3]|nr:hypothetical protein PLICRDRAFT_108036 [Plicaturopsis crispa FD-325 SS-3]